MEKFSQPMCAQGAEQPSQNPPRYGNIKTLTLGLLNPQKERNFQRPCGTAGPRDAIEEGRLPVPLRSVSRNNVKLGVYHIDQVIPQ